MPPHEFSWVLGGLLLDTQAAFERAISELASGAERRPPEQALPAQHPRPVIEALNLDPAASDDLRETLRKAFRAGDRGEIAAHLPPSGPGACTDPSTTRYAESGLSL